MILEASQSSSLDKLPAVNTDFGNLMETGPKGMAKSSGSPPVHPPRQAVAAIQKKPAEHDQLRW
jgi:hypothetical protein